MNTINPYKMIYLFALQKHMADVEALGLQKGSTLERLSYALIWPYTILASMGVTLVAIFTVWFAVWFSQIAWGLVLTL